MTVPGTQAAAIVMPRLAQQLAALRQQRDEIAPEVERPLRAHRPWPVLTSMPGVGVMTAARPLTEAAHKAFPSAAQLAAYAMHLLQSGSTSVSSLSGTRASKRLTSTSTPI